MYRVCIFSGVTTLTLYNEFHMALGVWIVVHIFYYREALQNGTVEGQPTVTMVRNNSLANACGNYLT